MTSILLTGSTSYLRPISPTEEKEANSTAYPPADSVVLNESQEACLNEAIDPGGRGFQFEMKTPFSLRFQIQLPSLIEKFRRLLANEGIELLDFRLIGSSATQILQGKGIEGGDLDFLAQVKTIDYRGNRTVLKKIFLAALLEESKIVRSEDKKNGTCTYFQRGRQLCTLPQGVNPFEGSYHRRVLEALSCNEQSLFVTLPTSANGAKQSIDIRVNWEEEVSCISSANSFQCNLLPGFLGETAERRIECAKGYSVQRSLDLLNQGCFEISPDFAIKTSDGLRAYTRLPTKGLIPSNTQANSEIEKSFLQKWESEYGFETEGLHLFFNRVGNYLIRHYKNNPLGAATYLCNLRTFFITQDFSRKEERLKQIDQLASECLTFFSSNSSENPPIDISLLHTLLFWSSNTSVKKWRQCVKSPSEVSSTLFSIPLVNKSFLLTLFPLRETFDLLQGDDNRVSFLLQKFGLPGTSADFRRVLLTHLADFPAENNAPIELLKSLFINSKDSEELFIRSFTEKLPHQSPADLVRIRSQLNKHPSLGGMAMHIPSDASASPKAQRLSFLLSLCNTGSEPRKRAAVKVLLNTFLTDRDPPTPDELRSIRETVGKLSGPLRETIQPRIDDHLERQAAEDPSRFGDLLEREIEIIRIKDEEELLPMLKKRAFPSSLDARKKQKWENAWLTRLKERPSSQLYSDFIASPLIDQNLKIELTDSILQSSIPPIPFFNCWRTACETNCLSVRQALKYLKGRSRGMQQHHMSRFLGAIRQTLELNRKLGELSKVEKEQLIQLINLRDLNTDQSQDFWQILQLASGRPSTTPPLTNPREVLLKLLPFDRDRFLPYLISLLDSKSPAIADILSFVRFFQPSTPSLMHLYDALKENFESQDCIRALIEDLMGNTVWKGSLIKILIERNDTVFLEENLSALLDDSRDLPFEIFKQLIEKPFPPPFKLQLLKLAQFTSHDEINYLAREIKRYLEKTDDFLSSEVAEKFAQIAQNNGKVDPEISLEIAFRLNKAFPSLAHTLVEPCLRSPKLRGESRQNWFLKCLNSKLMEPPKLWLIANDIGKKDSTLRLAVGLQCLKTDSEKLNLTKLFESFYDRTEHFPFSALSDLYKNSRVDRESITKKMASHIAYTNASDLKNILEIMPDDYPFHLLTAACNRVFQSNCSFLTQNLALEKLFKNRKEALLGLSLEELEPVIFLILSKRSDYAPQLAALIQERTRANHNSPQNVNWIDKLVGLVRTLPESTQSKLQKYLEALAVERIYHKKRSRDVIIESLKLFLIASLSIFSAMVFYNGELPSFFGSGPKNDSLGFGFTSRR